MNKTALSIGALLICFSLSGCNTSRGFGADLEQLGSWMKNAGKKEPVTTEAATTEQPATEYRVEDSAYSQPYQDPSYTPEGEVPTATTYPVDQGQSYPEYK